MPHMVTPSLTVSPGCGFTFQCRLNFASSPQEVTRSEGRTEAIVDEGIAVVSYALDDVRADESVTVAS